MPERSDLTPLEFVSVRDFRGFRASMIRESRQLRAEISATTAVLDQVVGRLEALNLNGSAQALRELGHSAPTLSALGDRAGALIKLADAAPQLIRVADGEERMLESRAARRKVAADLGQLLHWKRIGRSVKWLAPFFMGAIGYQIVHALSGVHIPGLP